MDMEGEQFSLSWNEFHKNLSSGFNALLEDSSLVDVSLAVEGRKIQAHKVVLSVCSDYFKELFNGNPCQHPIVFLKDVNYTVMQNILQFMYQGEVNVSQADLAEFLKTAEDLKVKGLTGSNKDKSKSNSQDMKSEIATPPGMSRSGRLRRTQSPLPQLSQMQHRKSAPASSGLPNVKRPKFLTGPALASGQPVIKKQIIEASEHETEVTETRNVVEHIDIPDTNTMLTNLKSEPVDYDMGDDTMDESMKLSESDFPGDSFEGGEEEPKPGSSVDFLHHGDEDKDSVNQDGILIYFVESVAGNPLLVVNNNAYGLAERGNHKLYWRCIDRHHGCKMTCITMDGQIQIKPGLKHCHSPNMNKLSSRRTLDISLNDVETMQKHKFKQKFGKNS